MFFSNYGRSAGSTLKCVFNVIIKKRKERFATEQDWFVDGCCARIIATLVCNTFAQISSIWSNLYFLAVPNWASKFPKSENLILMTLTLGNQTTYYEHFTQLRVLNRNLFLLSWWDEGHRASADLIKKKKRLKITSSAALCVEREPCLMWKLTKSWHLRYPFGTFLGDVCCLLEFTRHATPRLPWPGAQWSRRCKYGVQRALKWQQWWCFALGANAAVRGPVTDYNSSFSQMEKERTRERGRGRCKSCRPSITGPVSIHSLRLAKPCDKGACQLPSTAQLSPIPAEIHPEAQATACTLFLLLSVSLTVSPSFSFCPCYDFTCSQVRTPQEPSTQVSSAPLLLSLSYFSLPRLPCFFL